MDQTTPISRPYFKPDQSGPWPNVKLDTPLSGIISDKPLLQRVRYGPSMI